jgi:integrase
VVTTKPRDVGLSVGNRKLKLTKRTADAAVPSQLRYIVWDTVLPGFGLRVAPSGTKTFILRYRPKLGHSAPKRFMTFGRFGPVTVDEARTKAMKIIGAVADGHDPAATLRENRKAMTVEEAVREFLAEHVSIKRKAKTLASYRHALSRHIIPKLGRKKIQDVTKADVIKLHTSKSSTPAAANYAVAALGSLYTWAARRGHIAEDFNPTRRIDKFRENRRERFLTTAELQRLGDALREAETNGLPWNVDETKPTTKHAPKPNKRLTMVSPFAIAAIRLLLFTGCRLREIIDVRWEHVDFERGVLFLPDSKSEDRAARRAGTARPIRLVSRWAVRHRGKRPGKGAIRPEAALERDPAPGEARGGSHPRSPTFLRERWGWRRAWSSSDRQAAWPHAAEHDGPLRSLGR